MFGLPFAIVDASNENDKLDYVILTACITVWIRSNTTPFQLLFEVDFGAFPNGWVGPLLYDYSQDSNIYIKCLKTYICAVNRILVLHTHL